MELTQLEELLLRMLVDLEYSIGTQTIESRGFVVTPQYFRDLLDIFGLEQIYENYLKERKETNGVRSS